ncbi:uncharacterized protein At4g08330, chloroplastic-like [Oryza brachyantha]|uniref:MsrB domain-containing protein n=1 Tax=Oryza brachyantha TaxID=4533 RepID=J3L5J0_ORYBR|nr:uncharacterized protein At4g08330, chloroplastic-like [Oryza brachyantha]
MVRSLDSYSSIKDVTYSCGYCGYALNLSSSTRNTANIGSKYGKQIKKGVVSFFAVDESRFTQADEVTCVPYFHSRRSWGLFRRRSRLLCRKCGGRIGSAYEEDDPAALSACDADGGPDDLRTTSSGSSGGGSTISSSASSRRNYVIKINALQPSSDDSDAVAFTL